MRAVARNGKQAQKRASVNAAKSRAVAPAASHLAHPILSLQRTIGNQAVQVLLSRSPAMVQTKLPLSSPSDAYEQEADRVSEQVMGRTEPRSPRALMEPRLGRDFSRARLQTGATAVQRQETSGGSALQIRGSPEELRPRSTYRGPIRDELRNHLSDLVDEGVTTYTTYRDAISKSNTSQKHAALNTALLFRLMDTLDYLSFARCVESLGRRAPTFDELRKHSLVIEALTLAWSASDIGVRDIVTQAHEEGGWIFMNLIDGSLTISRARAEGTNYIRLEPPPDVENSVLVAMFHTHPTLGRSARPSSHDLREDARRGVPNLVAGNTGNDPKVFQVHLSGPSVRKHLASTTKIPGPSGGLAP